MRLSFKKPLHFVFFLFVVWRIFLFTVPVLATPFLRYRSDFAFTNISYYTSDTFLKNSVLNPWANFDGVNYLAIAGRGYETDVRFFPVFPLIINGMMRFVGTHKLYGIGSYAFGLILANGSFFLALYFLYELLRLDFSEKISRWSLIFLLFFPTSFFFGSIYSESIFLLLTVVCFYFARKGKWWLAALFGTVLTATRLVGIFIFPALLFEFMHQEPFVVNFKKVRDYEVKDVIQRIFPIFLVPLGLISYIWFNYFKWRRWFYFLEAQGDLQNNRTVNGVVDPLHTCIRYAKILTSLSPKIYEWWVALLEITCFFLGTFLLYFAWKKKIRPSYLIFSILCFALPSFSGNFTGLPRYVLISFPIFIILGMIKNQRIRWGVLFISILLLTLLTALFSRGYFVA
jgi:hypothetical protein